MIIFLIFCYQLRDLSNKVTFHRVKKSELLESNIELNFCYFVNKKEDKLSADHHYDKNRRENNRNSKKDSCDLKKSLSQSSKRFQNKTVSFIIQHLKKCKLEKLIQSKNLSEIKEIKTRNCFFLKRK